MVVTCFNSPRELDVEMLPELLVPTLNVGGRAGSSTCRQFRPLTDIWRRYQQFWKHLHHQFVRGLR